MTRRCDTLILGGGTAGAATAIALARSGVSTILVERSHYDRISIGEIPPAAAKTPLTALGVWDRFAEAHHPPACGALLAWGDDDLRAEHELNEPDNGWQLNRSRFDAMLADEAERAGTTVYCDASVIGGATRVGDQWRVSVVVDDIVRQIHAPLVVDATGRASAFARRLGAMRVQSDELVAVVGVASIGPSSRAHQEPALMEASCEGWWYSSVMPNGHLAIAFMTDADLVPGDARQLRAFWDKHLEKALHMKERAAGATMCTEPRLVAAESGRLNRASGLGWIAVGDAAASFDPVLTKGIYAALQSGLEAARAITTSSSSGPDALLFYDEMIQTRFRDYFEARIAHYGREQRWPSSLFWKRRHLQLQRTPLEHTPILS